MWKAVGENYNQCKQDLLHNDVDDETSKHNSHVDSIIKQLLCNIINNIINNK